MEKYIWDNIDENNQTPALKYWVDIWCISLDNFTERDLGLKFDSPRILLNELKDEISFNGLRNKAVKKFFIEEISNYLGLKHLLPEDLYVSLNLLNKSLKSEYNLGHLNKIVHRATREIDQNKFFELLHSNLISLIKGDINENVKQDIRTVTRLMIIEFLYQGFSFSKIRKIPKIIFDQITTDSNRSVLFTDYPTEINMNDYIENDVMNWNKYGKDLESFFKGLTYNDRLDSMKKIFFQPQKEIRFIFPLRGIKGMETVRIGDVTFYNPTKEPFLNEKFKYSRSMELFNQPENTENIYLNASILLSTRDNDHSIIEAKEQVEESLDLINFFMNPELPISIEDSGHLCLHPDGTIAQMSSQNKWVDNWYKSLDFDNPPIQPKRYRQLEQIAENLKQAKGNFDTSQIAHSFHWYHKAEKESSHAEKLLNYWIALERLFNQEQFSTLNNYKTSQLIQKFLPKIVLGNFIYQRGWDLFHHIRSLVNTSQGGRDLIYIPTEIKNKMKLGNFVGKVVLQNFIDDIPELITYIESEVIKDELQQVQLFYTNNEYALSEINKKNKIISNEILQIYRFRNKIVHDAQFNGASLPYFSKQIEVYVSNALAFSIKVLSDEKPSISEAFLDESLRIDHIIGSLSLSPNFNLIEQSSS